MAEVRVTQEDIDSLGQKLARLDADLTESERALLAFMFSLAADAIRKPAGPLDSLSEKQDIPLAVGDTPVSIHDQFHSAFTPDAGQAGLLPGSIGPAPSPRD